MDKLDLKGRGTRDQTANICWITEKPRELQKNINFCFIDTTPMAERERELKSLLMKVKESEKADLKLSIQKTKIMATGPITSWQTDGETVSDYFGGLQNHCRW